MAYDFSGYVTKTGLKCSDGRVIQHGAFKECNGTKVPLLWQHGHGDPDNVLGNVVLECRNDGVYGYGTFNNNPKAKTAKELIAHGDISAMSIYANQLVQMGANVTHGCIKEVSLVLAGANPGAFIDNLRFQHGEIIEDADDEAIIYSGDNMFENEQTNIQHADEGDETILDVFNTLDAKQKKAVYAMIAMAAGDSGEMAQSEMEEDEGMPFNVFEGQDEGAAEKTTLTHSEIQEILDDAKKCGSLKESFLAHAQSYGIENIDILFPDAKTVTPTPDFIKRDTDWVAGVLSETRHTPFSRIKSTAADITADEARARGYVKGNLKKEEVIKLLKRVTGPTTIYKKQKLDRDDIIDITDLNVVAWLKSEMRLMLNEELARAILIGDGREADSEDKINEENIRPIWKDDDMYSHHVTVEATTTTEELMELILRAKKNYKGSGAPKFYTTSDIVVDMLLLKDNNGRRYYNSVSEVASALGVSGIVEVPVMESQTRTTDTGAVSLVGIIANLKDYVVGADKGGQVSMFDDFDIDYNQYKYLLETRCSGTLVHPKSALVIERKNA